MVRARGASGQAAAAVAAYVIAAAVHLGVAGLMTGGVLLILLGWDTVVQPAVGVVLLVLAAYLCPRPATWAPNRLTLARQQAPELFGLLDRAADAAGARRIDAVRLNADFSTGVTTAGARRRRVLLLGYPLWVGYGRQQRVAAVVHALARQAHDIRGDAMVDAALVTLRRASLLAGRPPVSEGAADLLLKPNALTRHGDGMTTAAGQFATRTRLVDWALWVPGLIARGTELLLLRAARPSARSAERRADVLAARAGSPSAAAAVLRDQDLAPRVAAEMHRLAVTARTFRRSGDDQGAADAYWESVGRYARTRRPGRGPTADSGTGTAATLTLAQTTADAIQRELGEASRALTEAIIQGGHEVAAPVIRVGSSSQAS